MILDMDGLLKAFGVLAALLVPLWLGARALRGRGPAGRRLGIAEVIALDARRRLVPLHRGFDRLLAAVRRQKSVLLQSLDVLAQHDQPVKISVRRY